MNGSEIMGRAIELAAKAKGKTGPNPLVGAVITANGTVIGEGYHHYYGGDHAEVDAIKNAAVPVSGADMYVSLEPCFHFGKTPPCVEAIVKSGIKKVTAAMVDPNPNVSGKGIEMLRASGVEVEVGILEKEARRLNEAYIKFITTGLPFVTLKIAQTLDGKIADANGNSKWITSEESRRQVHLLRSYADAVLVGAKTVRHDNPSLTSHGAGDRDPLRLILSRSGELPRDVQLLATNADSKTILVTANAACQTAGIMTWSLPGNEQGNVDLSAFLRHAGEQKIVNLLVEGGSEIFSEFIRQKLVDKFIFVVAPKLLGNGISFFNDPVRKITEMLQLRIDSSYRIGNDIWIEAYPE